MYAQFLIGPRIGAPLHGDAIVAMYEPIGLQNAYEAEKLKERKLVLQQCETCPRQDYQLVAGEDGVNRCLPCEQRRHKCPSPSATPPPT